MSLPAAGSSRRRATAAARPQRLAALEDEVVACRRCPRLVAWREAVATSPAALRRGEPYWARPVPGFGDPRARLLVVGLAPAAHGGNRTGRMFTGDRSGDVLYAALHRAGFATSPLSIARGDGLEMRDAFITAAVRCAPPDNRPLPDERDRCAAFLSGELALLSEVRVVLALGAFAFEALRRTPGVAEAIPAGGRRARFAHGLEIDLGSGPRAGVPRTLLCSYHPSQRNVFTGLLTPAMLDAVITRARQLIDD